MTQARAAAAMLLLACVFGSPGLMAHESVITAEPEVILNYARGFGGARLSEDAEGDPMIDGRIEGTRYLILFYGCEDGANCTEIQLTAGWTGSDLSLEDVNAWNREYRFAKAYIDDEGDPILEMNLNLEHGVSPNNLDSSFEWWATMLKGFTDEALN